uniref:RNA binding motif protein 34 n=1 Tax=Salarias fasciatus TaxID=181472 RepID=A0A672GX50_SALFA
ALLPVCVLSETPSADYVVGQVSGSVFRQSSAASASLSALFSTDAPAAPLRFQPPPKVKRGRAASASLFVFLSVRSPAAVSQSFRLSSPRESALQEADREEQGPSAARRSEKERWVLRRQRLKAGRQEEALKAQRTVFVGNLPVSCTKKVGPVAPHGGLLTPGHFRVREDPSMTRKLATIKRKVHPKKQSMNAYVVFQDEAGAGRALERNGMEVEKDFHIRVDRAGGASAHDHRRSVFVGNLSFGKPLCRHFAECGDVEAVRLVRDKNSGLGKGFGYVLFQSADSVQLALELDGSKLQGRAVRVKRSVKKEKEGKAPGPKAGAAPRRFKSHKALPGKQQTSSQSSFSGEKADPNRKAKKKGVKKRVTPRRPAHP